MNEFTATPHPPSIQDSSLSEINHKFSGTVRRILNRWKRNPTRGLKEGYIASILLGLFLVWRYTSAARIPFPIVDASFLITIALTAGAALFCWGLLTIFLFQPAGMTIRSLGGLQLLSTGDNLRNRQLIDSNAAAPAPGFWVTSLWYLAAYGTVFLPYIVSMISVPIMWAVGAAVIPRLSSKQINVEPAYVALVLVILIAFLFAVGVFVSKWICGRSATPGATIVTKLGAGVRQRGDTDSITSASGASMVSGIIVVLMIVLVASRIHLLGQDAGPLSLLAICLGVIGWHFVLTTLAAWGQFLLIGLVGAIVIMEMAFPYGPTSGAIALRLLGIGGGVPIDAVVKVVNAGSEIVRAEHVHGCLVMWGPGQVSLQRPVDASKAIRLCHLSPITRVMEKGEYIRTVVDTIGRGDVLDIYDIGFPGNLPAE